jgi:hypothetical protein
VNTNVESVAARCSRSRSARNGGSVIVREEAGVVGGPSHTGSFKID